MQVDQVDAAERRRLFLYLTKRHMAAEARLIRLEPPIESLESGDAGIKVTPEAIAARESVKATEADQIAWRGGTVRDELRARLVAIEAGRLVTVPDSSVELTFRQQLDPTGMRTKFLWIARDGDRVRGVILSITYQLRPMLQPTAADDELWHAVLQLAMPKLRAAIQDLDAFFATTDDLEIILHVNEVDLNWERGLRFPTL
jgi:hypothetical protein